MARTTFQIGSEALSLDLLREYLDHPFRLELSPEAVARIEHCRCYLDEKVKQSDKPIYGVTTGFGSLCNRTITPDQLTALQENLVKSHACSCGTPVHADIVRLMLLLKAHALQLGHSGVQLCTVERILDMLNHDVLPIVYDRGSLGASGDLAPLA
ncbi:aromatic amino acid lyase, partial [Porphyromonas loveana]